MKLQNSRERLVSKTKDAPKSKEKLAVYYSSVLRPSDERGSTEASRPYVQKTVIEKGKIAGEKEGNGGQNGD